MDSTLVLRTSSRILPTGMKKTAAVLAAVFFGRGTARRLHFPWYAWRDFTSLFPWSMARIPFADAVAAAMVVM